MDILERIKTLCRTHGMSISQLEDKLGFGRNYLYSWKKRMPGVDKVKRVADYFDVSVDYLLGRSDKKYWELNDKDERDIQKQLDKMVKGISNEQSLAFFETNDGNDLSDSDKALLRASLEQTLRLSKELAKKKFTPNKYRN